MRVAFSASASVSPGHHLAIWDPDLDDDLGLGDPEAAAELDRPPSSEDTHVLVRIAMGQTGSSIARDLHISPAAARSRIRRCVAKLGAMNRPHAVLLGSSGERSCCPRWRSPEEPARSRTPAAQSTSW